MEEVTRGCNVEGGGSSRPYNKCIKPPKEKTEWGRGEVSWSRVLR